MLLQEGSARSQERGSLCLPHSVPNVVVCVGVSLGVCVCVLFGCVVVVCECSVVFFFLGGGGVSCVSCSWPPHNMLCCGQSDWRNPNW